MRDRRSDRRGFSRAAVLLILAGLTAAMLLLLPAFRTYRTHAQSIACASALDTARRQLAAEYLTEGGLTVEQAEERLDIAMNGLNDLCPAGGSVYLIPDEENGTGYSLICGLHEADRALRTRTNASYAKEQLEAGFPLGEMTVTLNGKTFTAVQTDDLSHTMDLPESADGKLNYSILFTAENGVITRFGFADDSRCAIWDLHEGWSGTAYNEN